MVGILPFPLLGKVADALICFGVNSVPDLTELMVDKVSEPIVVGSRQIPRISRIA